jgi:hypothetical protein
LAKDVLSNPIAFQVRSRLGRSSMVALRVFTIKAATDANVEGRGQRSIEMRVVHGGCRGSGSQSDLSGDRRRAPQLCPDPSASRPMKDSPWPAR